MCAVIAASFPFTAICWSDELEEISPASQQFAAWVVSSTRVIKSIFKRFPLPWSDSKCQNEPFPQQGQHLLGDKNQRKSSAHLPYSVDHEKNESWKSLSILMKMMIRLPLHLPVFFRKIKKGKPTRRQMGLQWHPPPHIPKRQKWFF